MNLKNMTLHEKNALIHTHVMQRPLVEYCTGEIVDVHEHRFCLVCGHKGDIGELRDENRHRLPLPDYFSDLNAVWCIFGNQGPLVGTHFELWSGLGNTIRCIIHNYPRQHAETIAFSQHGPADAVCNAVLLALHIINGEDEILDASYNQGVEA